MAALRRVTISFSWQPAYWATVVGVAMVVTGFGLLAMGWRGSAALLLVPLQVPFAVSGGIAGLALVGLGVALVKVQVTRHVAARERARDAILLREATAALVLAQAQAGDGSSGSTS